MKNCPDCQSDLSPIEVLDATHRGIKREGIQHTPMRYAAPEADRGLFTGKVKSLGEVGAHLCRACGRIFLYAKPDD